MCKQGHAVSTALEHLLAGDPVLPTFPDLTEPLEIFTYISGS